MGCLVDKIHKSKSVSALCLLYSNLGHSTVKSARIKSIAQKYHSRRQNSYDKTEGSREPCATLSNTFAYTAIFPTMERLFS